MLGFSGSYAPEDVTFLLKEIRLTSTAIDAKERHIQNGGHYSEVLTLEEAPPPEYMALYEEVLARNQTRFAQDVLRLAQQIKQDRPSEIVVVSLARAGTPVGVLVNRALNQLLGVRSVHYCVSIIRDRGLDLNALRYIVAQHGSASIVFVDGWTGKGVIGRELAASVTRLNEEDGLSVSPHLYVVADIAGTAHYAATYQDYLLPSAILNSTVSGLVSRTVLTAEIGPEDFHGCVQYPHLAEHDQSRQFVDRVFAEMAQLASLVMPDQPADKTRAATAMTRVLAHYRALYGIRSDNLIKPGIGEATRVMLRRKPLMLAVKSKDAADVGHLLFLARERCVLVVTDQSLPYQALALINHAD